jgi:hypothetical protein
MGKQFREVAPGEQLLTSPTFCPFFTIPSDDLSFYFAEKTACRFRRHSGLASQEKEKIKQKEGDIHLEPEHGVFVDDDGGNVLESVQR